MAVSIITVTRTNANGATKDVKGTIAVMEASGSVERNFNGVFTKRGPAEPDSGSITKVGGTNSYRIDVAVSEGLWKSLEKGLKLQVTHQGERVSRVERVMVLMAVQLKLGPVEVDLFASMTARLPPRVSLGMTTLLFGRRRLALSLGDASEGAAHSVDVEINDGDDGARSTAEPATRNGRAGTASAAQR